ncbi:MAG: hypothetical protein ACTHNU_01025 [Gaiellales bacterium]
MALEYDVAAELADAIAEHSGAEPVVTMAEDTALVSYRHPHQVITDIWVRREQAWRLLASQISEL